VFLVHNVKIKSLTYEQCWGSESKPDPHVLGPPGFESISQMYGSGSGSVPFLIKVLSGLK
jgi:hypothetical protein